MKNSSRKNKKAFTLVEVMLAVGVLSVAISIMIALLGAIIGNLSQIRYQNKAITLLADLETTLRMQSFDTVFDWVRDPSQPYVIYFWDQFQNPEDPDNSSLVTVSSELPGRVKQHPPTQEELADSSGELYRANLMLYQNALKGNHISINSPEAVYSSGPIIAEADDYALSGLPITVEFFVEPRDDITVGAGEGSINDQRRVYTGMLMKMR